MPIQHVEVQIDDGAWQRATLDDRRGKYAWRLWSLNVKDLAPGTHTVVSRAIDANGVMQPTEERTQDTARERPRRQHAVGARDQRSS